MKLIIDIPERYYEFCRECLINRTDTVDQQFIAKGIPYEERPKGKWVFDENIYNWKCSRCRKIPKTIGYVGNKYFMQAHFKYCNHCGADMREVTKNEVKHS